jgi:hypothetical protein
MHPRVTPARGKGEVPEKRLRLLALKIDGATGAHDPETAQERDLQGGGRDRSRRAN